MLSTSSIYANYAKKEKKEKQKTEKVKKTKEDKEEETSVYIFGVSASFLDSLVYFTDIEELQGVRIKKDGLLPYRQEYSNQLKNYMEQTEGQTNRTCFIYFNKKRKKLDKLETKLKQRYAKGGALYIQQVNPNTFHFEKYVEPASQE